MSIEALRRRRQAGLTLIELILFIVIVGAAAAGALTVLQVTVMKSSDPMIRKQLLAAAEALLEEVEMMPFTYCDPADPNAATAEAPILDVTNTDGKRCVAAVQELGPGATLQTRTDASNPFNHVADYWAVGGLTLSPIWDVSGTIQAPPGYAARIEIVPESFNGIAPVDSTAANLNSLRIAVTVSGGGESLTLEGYRTRHSPNGVP